MSRPRSASLLPPARPWRLLSRIGVLLIAATLVADRALGGETMTTSLAIFLVAGVAILRLRDRLPDLLLFLLVVAALASGAGGAFEWFDDVRWFDECVHFYTGFAGLAAIGHAYARDGKAPRFGLPAWCAGMGLALGIGWECIEAIGGDLEAVDTVSDVVLDTAGAALGGWFARRLLQDGRPVNKAMA